MTNNKRIMTMSDDDFLKELLAGQKQSKDLGAQLNALVETPKKPDSRFFRGTHREHLRAGSKS